MNNCKCENFSIDVHRASFPKFLRNKIHLKNEKQIELMIP